MVLYKKKKRKKKLKDKIEVDLLFMVGVVIEKLLMIRLWRYLGFFFFLFLRKEI